MNLRFNIIRPSNDIFTLIQLSFEIVNTFIQPTYTQWISSTQSTCPVHRRNCAHQGFSHRRNSRNAAGKTEKGLEGNLRIGWYEFIPAQGPLQFSFKRFSLPGCRKRLRKEDEVEEMPAQDNQWRFLRRLELNASIGSGTSCSRTFIENFLKKSMKKR